MRRLTGALLLALTTAACGSGEAGPGPDPGRLVAALTPCDARSVISVGEGVPACTFEGMEDFEDVSIPDLVGRPMVINFWASWCTFCIKEMPDFQRVHESLGDRVSIVGLDVVGIQGETRSAAETFRARTGAAYLMAFDPDGAFYARFQPQVLRPVMPITIFADADGVVAEKFFGPLTEQQLRDRIFEHFEIT